MEDHSNSIICLLGYQNTKTDDFKFFRTTMSRPFDYTETDHTYKSEYGKFSFFSYFSSYAFNTKEDKPRKLEELGFS